MKSAWMIAVLFAAAGFSVRAEGQETDRQAEIREWVSRLGAAEYEIREKAETRIKEEYGREALALLEEMSNSDDVELSERCRRLVAWVRRCGGLPEFLKTHPQWSELASKEPEGASLYVSDDPKKQLQGYTKFLNVFIASPNVFIASPKEKAGSQGMAAMLEFLNSEPDGNVRISALQQLLSLRQVTPAYGTFRLDEANQARLLETYQNRIFDGHTDAVLKLRFLELLIQVRPEGFSELVLQKMKEGGAGDPALQWAAGALKIREAGPLLLKELKNGLTESGPAKTGAVLIWSLMELSEQNAAEALESLLEDDSPIFPVTFDFYASVPGMERVIHRGTAEGQVRDRALEALIRISGGKPSEYLGKVPLEVDDGMGPFEAAKVGKERKVAGARMSATGGDLLLAPPRFEMSFQNDDQRRRAIEQWRKSDEE